MAQDGVGVVLAVTEADIVLLCCTDQEWVITRHPRQPDSAGTRPVIRYFGQTFAAQGVQVARFAEHAPADEWDAVYRQLLGV